MSAAKILWKEFRNISNPKTGLKQVHVEIPDENIFVWNVSLMVVDPESMYHGSYLTGQLRFPSDYPFSPPSFRFTPAIFHPNVYVDGRLCISILHTANLEVSDEPVELTWSPAQNVESVLLSILSLLEDPNVNSPANVEASICYRKQKDVYAQKVKADVLRSKERMPADIVLPTLDDITASKQPVPQDTEEGEGWWEDDFYDDDEEEDEDEDDESDADSDDAVSDDGEDDDGAFSDSH